MARIEDNTLLKGLSGKIDGFIIYHVGEKTFARRLPETVKDPKTEKQLLQRSKFPGVQTLYRSVKKNLVKEIFDIAAREEGNRSGYHLFIHANMKAFGKDGFIDYSQLQLSRGRQQLPFHFTRVGVNGLKVEFSWLDNSYSVTSQGSDLFQVAAVFDDEPYRVVLLEGISARRRDGRVVVLLPEGEWKEAHLYCFFSTDDRVRHSVSVYYKVSR